MNKKIIAIYGRKNEGKTDTIRRIVDNIKTLFPNSTDGLLKTEDGEIFGTIQIENTRIGIESQGDPKGRMMTQDTLSKLTDCNIIICATRTRGETVHYVENIASKSPIIWISSSYCPELNHDILNELAARHILQIITSLLAEML